MIFYAFMSICFLALAYLAWREMRGLQPGNDPVGKFSKGPQFFHRPHPKQK